MKQTSTMIISVLGTGVVDSNAPIAMADDLALTRGEGVFDSTVVYRQVTGPRILHLDWHLARLERSAQGMGIECPSRDAWRRAIDDALDVWHGHNAVIRLILSRGREVVTDDPAQHLAYVLLSDIKGKRAHPAQIRVTQLSIGRPHDAFVDAPWLLGGVKTLSYATNMSAFRYATARGFDDVLFTTTDGYCLEAPRAGLIWAKDGRLGTTSREGTGVLDSMTVRAAVAGARSEGFEVVDGLLGAEEIFSADGAWLVSVSYGCTPIIEVDGRPLSVHEHLTQRMAVWTKQPYDDDALD
ncbi:aminodeoxychorismate lyase [Propionibacterium freudenreichii]|uniref:aminodeoxychorismate lyase n=2 Tax=Propionibacteriaceae TaxID=31957 RepID=UPI0021A3405A|nr:aminodeoxychorismate lyase [Propionibacterium freudenreichii]MCT2990768.1 aminodeoxychorismate lyase [Propionibacterium freudenreichii]MCT2992834.1 aminodeoxychorismate lyase [Propionibacterium freudenreichii]